MKTKSKNFKWLPTQWLTTLAAIVFVFILLCAGGGIKTAYAAEEDVASWTASGTCEWGIDPNGCLWIRPSDGVSGTLADWGISYAPWYGAKASVKSVVVKPGVSATTCCKMFNSMTNCTTMDLSGLNTSNVTNMQQMFSGCSSLTSLDLNGFDTGNVTNMNGMFGVCSKLTSLDVSSFDTSKVTNMSYMFSDCSGLTSLDVSGFDTGNVTNMGSMFNGCSKLTSLDVSGFDTGNVTNMGYMFSGCSGLTSLDVSEFDTGNVTNMGSMFNGCSKLTSLDVSGFDTGNVTNMGNMFYNCSVLTSLDVSGFDTGNVTNMSYMFSGCSGLTSLDVSGFDTSKVTNMSGMFNGCRCLTSLDVSGWDTSNVTNMCNMFYNCSVLTSLDVSEFDTGNVTNMGNMFYNCSVLTSLDVSGFDTGNVTNMSYMFSGCSGLTSLDVSGFDTSKVTNMSGMFNGCRCLTSLDVSNLNTSSATNIYGMFDGCSALTSIDVSRFDTGNVTNMGNMFNGCRCLTSLDVSGFDTSKVTNMSGMFNGCRCLTSLDVSGFDTGNVTNMYQMFYNCSALTSLDVSSFDTSKVTNMGNMFYNCSVLTSLDVSGFDTGNVTNMKGMFGGCSSLSNVTLGEKFSFKGKNITNSTYQALLPPPPSNATYTGKWIRDDSAVGPFTSTELREQYGDNAALWAGTWVWQEKPTTYSITFIPAENTTGSMPIQKAKADEDVTINPCLFKRFNYHLDHWEGSDGNEYADGAVIPANTFAVGDSLTLTAVFAENDNNVNIQDGKFTLTIHGGEKATFDNLPAGLAYQVYEKTPDGWVLLTQTNTVGSIEPLQTSEAYFLNKYQPGTTTATFYGTKIMDGRAAQAGEYTFELLQDETVIQAKQNGDSGFIQFDTIEYDTVGTYTYTIREVPGNNNDIDYDRHEETVTVEVTKDADNNLHAEVSYDTDGVYFVNRTKPGTIVIRKTAEGLTDANKDALFSFRVVLENENGTLVQGGNYHWYVLDANGEIVE